MKDTEKRMANPEFYNQQRKISFINAGNITAFLGEGKLTVCTIRPTLNVESKRHAVVLSSANSREMTPGRAWKFQEHKNGNIW